MHLIIPSHVNSRVLGYWSSGFSNFLFSPKDLCFIKFYLFNFEKRKIINISNIYVNFYVDFLVVSYIDKYYDNPSREIHNK